MPETTFEQAVARVSDDVSRALTRIERGEGPETELHNVRAYLVNLLEIAEPDPGLEAACDDLYGAASAFVAATRVSPEGRQRLLREAYLRFSGQIMRATPSLKARGMGLA